MHTNYIIQVTEELDGTDAELNRVKSALQASESRSTQLQSQLDGVANDRDELTEQRRVDGASLMAASHKIEDLEAAIGVGERDKGTLDNRIST